MTLHIRASNFRVPGSGAVGRRGRPSHEATEHPQRDRQQVDHVTALEVLTQKQGAQQEEIQRRRRLQKDRVGRCRELGGQNEQRQRCCVDDAQPDRPATDHDHTAAERGRAARSPRYQNGVPIPADLKSSDLDPAPPSKTGGSSEHLQPSPAGAHEADPENFRPIFAFILIR